MSYVLFARAKLDGLLLWWLAGWLLLSAPPVFGHEPAFHNAFSVAERFIASKNGQKEMAKAIDALYAAVTKNGQRPDKKRFSERAKIELKQWVSGQSAESFLHVGFIHVVRTWALKEAKPNPKLHLQRCETCNYIANAALKWLKLKPIKSVSPNSKNSLTAAKAVEVVKKANHKVYSKMSAEFKDINGDGFLESRALDNDDDGQFDAYQVDFDFDGFIDAFIINTAKGWIVAAQSGQ